MQYIVLLIPGLYAESLVLAPGVSFHPNLSILHNLNNVWILFLKISIAFSRSRIADIVIVRVGCPVCKALVISHYLTPARFLTYWMACCLTSFFNLHPLTLIPVVN